MNLTSNTYGTERVICGHVVPDKLFFLPDIVPILILHNLHDTSRHGPRLSIDTIDGAAGEWHYTGSVGNYDSIRDR